MDAVVYIHGKGGSAEESGHYGPLFPGSDVLGLDWRSGVPWEAGRELRAAVAALGDRYADVTLIANSIGAFFAMHGGLDGLVQRAFFISPIVDMEGLIGRMLAWAGATEDELRARGVVETDFGETLSWEYLRYVREHPLRWTAPTHILYGGRDHLTPPEAIRGFARAHGARLTVMEDGEHWFHTEEQMRFLDDWIRKENSNEKQR